MSSMYANDSSVRRNSIVYFLKSAQDFKVQKTFPVLLGINFSWTTLFALSQSTQQCSPTPVPNHIESNSNDSTLFFIKVL